MRVNWRAVINKIADANKTLQTAIRVGFTDGDLFYNEKVIKILRDPEIEHPILSQLSALSVKTLCVDLERDLKVEEFNSPFFDGTVDTDIYYDTIFAAGDEGLFSCKTSRIYAGAKNIRSEKHHDASFLQVKASNNYTAVAAAAGEDGLFEFVYERDAASRALGESRTLANRPCKACDWAFQSVLGWSESAAFLARFKEEKFHNEKTRLFERVVDLGEVFATADVPLKSTDESYTWGSREKLYRLGPDGIDVVDMNDQKPGKRSGKPENEFGSRFKGNIGTKFAPDEVVATATASFGTVLELADRLVVFRSDGHSQEFLGEPVHWRIFPRSEHYSNQLHVLYEEHMEVISFVHDYFVDQEDKVAGFVRGKGIPRSDPFASS